MAKDKDLAEVMRKHIESMNKFHIRNKKEWDEFEKKQNRIKCPHCGEIILIGKPQKG
jgi:hypothetical protein